MKRQNLITVVTSLSLLFALCDCSKSGSNGSSGLQKADTTTVAIKMRDQTPPSSPSTAGFTISGGVGNLVCGGNFQTLDGTFNGTASTFVFSIPSGCQLNPDAALASISGKTSAGTQMTLVAGVAQSDSSGVYVFNDLANLTCELDMDQSGVVNANPITIVQNSTGNVQFTTSVVGACAGFNAAFNAATDVLDMSVNMTSLDPTGNFTYSYSGSLTTGNGQFIDPALSLTQTGNGPSLDDKLSGLAQTTVAPGNYTFNIEITDGLGVSCEVQSALTIQAGATAVSTGSSASSGPMPSAPPIPAQIIINAAPSITSPVGMPITLFAIDPSATATSTFSFALIDSPNPNVTLSQTGSNLAIVSSPVATAVTVTVLEVSAGATVTSSTITLVFTPPPYTGPLTCKLSVPTSGASFGVGQVVTLQVMASDGEPTAITAATLSQPLNPPNPIPFPIPAMQLAFTTPGLVNVEIWGEGSISGQSCSNNPMSATINIVQ